MGEYKAIFIKIDGLLEEDLEPFYALKATTREEAVKEAKALSRPPGANFIKLINEGRYEGPKLGFGL